MGYKNDVTRIYRKDRRSSSSKTIRYSTTHMPELAIALSLSQERESRINYKENMSSRIRPNYNGWDLSIMNTCYDQRSPNHASGFCLCSYSTGIFLTKIASWGRFSSPLSSPCSRVSLPQRSTGRTSSISSWVLASEFLWQILLSLWPVFNWPTGWASLHDFLGIGVCRRPDLYGLQKMERNKMKSRSFSKISNMLASVLPFLEPLPKPKGFSGLLTTSRHQWPGLGPRYKSLLTVHKLIGRSKYLPHQGAKECERRRSRFSGRSETSL